MPTTWINALIGGVLIGVAVSLMLLWNGRVTGISGIINQTVSKDKDQGAWRILFLFGLIFGGLVLSQLNPMVFENQLNTSLIQTIVAGLLVGFGTVMGSGCTSGHGVCGVSRLSPRSILATVSFILSGIVTVYVIKNLVGVL